MNYDLRVFNGKVVEYKKQKSQLGNMDGQFQARVHKLEKDRDYLLSKCINTSLNGFRPKEDL